MGGVERTTRTKAQEVAGRAAGGKGWVEEKEALPQHSDAPVLTSSSTRGLKV